MSTVAATLTFTSTTKTVADLLDHLGGIAPERVRMYPLPGLATEADLIAVNARKQGICELVDGVLMEKPMGYPESILALVLAGYIQSFVVGRNLGIVSGADGMMRLFPGLVRVPDLAFVPWERIPGRQFPTTPIAGFVPDLAVEVLSPSNTKAEMARKRREYFDAGVRLIWEVDPRNRTVAVFETSELSIVLDRTQTLDGGSVLPGFVLPLFDLFGELDRRGN